MGPNAAPVTSPTVAALYHDVADNLIIHRRNQREQAGPAGPQRVDEVRFLVLLKGQPVHITNRCNVTWPLVSYFSHGHVFSAERLPLGRRGRHSPGSSSWAARRLPVNPERHVS